jgi:hypothetical protein
LPGVAACCFLLLKGIRLCHVASCRLLLLVAACCRLLRPPNGTKTARSPSMIIALSVEFARGS